MNAKIEIHDKVGWSNKLYGINLLDRTIRSALRAGADKVLVPKDVKSLPKYQKNKKIFAETKNIKADQTFSTNKLYVNGSLQKGLPPEKSVQFTINSPKDFPKIKQELFRSCRKKGNFGLDTIWFDWTGSNLARLISPLGVTPNIVTTIGLLIALVSCFFFAQGTYHSIVIGAVLVHVGFIFDSTDGRLARLKGLSSKFGAFYDGLLDSVESNLWLFGIALALYKTASPMIFFAAVVAIIGDNITLFAYSQNEENVDATNLLTGKVTFASIMAKAFRFVTYYEVRLFMILIFALINRLDILAIIFAILFNVRWLSLLGYRWINREK